MENLIHSLDDNNIVKHVTPRFFLTFIVIALAGGIIGGLLLSSIIKASPIVGKKTPSEKVAGIADKKTFKDQAEGILKEGGIDGEGSYHLRRPGGVSQNVYLTSSTVDLSGYVNKKVRVWGETFKGEKAGWLMDVGLVEILQ